MKPRAISRCISTPHDCQNQQRVDLPRLRGGRVVLGMVQPALFDQYFGYDLNLLIVPLIQIIMFGMGAKLSANDFIRVFVMPWPVSPWLLAGARRSPGQIHQPDVNLDDPIFCR